MFETNTNPPAETVAAQGILERIATPLLLFATALFVLLTLSYTLLLPRFTQFHRGDGTAMSPREFADYHKSLAADLTKKEEERVRLVLPVTDATYDELKALKRDLSLSELREQLMLAAGRVGEETGVVRIDVLSMEGPVVTVRGEVSNVGPRSMTVLAAYVERVQELPMVTDLDPPAFTREPDGDDGFRSPFTFSFSLKTE